MNARTYYMAWLVIVVAFAQHTMAQPSYDLAADFSDAQNPNGAWSFGWMASSHDVFQPYATPFAAYGLSLQEWRGPFPSDNGSAPPDVILNSADSPIIVSDTAWLPHQVTFHPGRNGEQSVVRWTSPTTGVARVKADFEGRSAFVTSGVEIWHNRTLLFSNRVWGAHSASHIQFCSNLVVQFGDRLDFRVNYSNHNWVSDTTQIGVRIIMAPSPELRLASNSPEVAELTWSTNTVGFLLETTAKLSSGSWIPLTNSPDVNGELFFLQLHLTNTQQYFRLRLE